MSNELDQTKTQEITPVIDWSKNEDAMLWIDVSIRNAELRRKMVGELCSMEDGKKRTPETWRQMFYDMRELGFEEVWLKTYKEHYKNRIGAKLYSRIDKVMDNERDLNKLVNVGEFIEGKQPTTAVQVNNIIGDKKSEYGL